MFPLVLLTLALALAQLYRVQNENGNPLVLASAFALCMVPISSIDSALTVRA